jgi:hypothetical protein
LGKRVKEAVRLFIAVTFIALFNFIDISYAQITIEEWINLGFDRELYDENRGTIIQEKFEGEAYSFWPEWYEHIFYPQEEGDLKVSLAQIYSQLWPVDPDANIQISIRSADGIRDTTIAIQPILGEPIIGPRFSFNSSEWYLYGPDPYVFSSSVATPGVGSNALVRYHHDAEYDSENERYIYRGSITDENFPNQSHLRGSVYDWGQGRDFDDGRYYSIERSFFKINLEPFQFPTAYVDSATIEFMVWSINPYLANPDGFDFHVFEVEQEWNPLTVTWANQPSISSTGFTIPNPELKVGNNAYDYHTLDLTQTVLRWLGNPDSNHGFAVKLEDETSSSGIQSHKHVGIRAIAPLEPIVNIHYSLPDYSPDSLILSAGTAAPGDTVLVRYNNGTDRPTSATSRRLRTRDVGGETVTGFVMKFEDRQRRDEGTGTGIYPEELFLFVYLDEPEEDDLEQILLGETKYFAAVEDPDDDRSILIKEVTPDANGRPAEPEGLLAGAFGDDPIEVLSGGKSGVYWERRWANIDSNGSISGGDLSSGMIRLVGRYWEEGNDYRVKLNAASGSRSGELEVEVVKPGRLGDGKTKYRDALGNTFDMDSLAIHHGGKKGIPPQFLMGIVEKESSFLAAFRYEKMLDYNYNMHDRFANVGNLIPNNPFWIKSESDQGTPGIPTNHNIHEQQGFDGKYPGYIGSIFDIFASFSFGLKVSQIRQTGDAQKAYESYQNKARKELISETENSETSEEAINQKAMELMETYLQEEFRDGLKNIPRQTRIMSSYGPLQLVYLFGFYERVYPLNTESLPELMNEDVTLAIESSLDFYIYRKFNINLFSQTDVKFEQNQHWPHGFEESLRRAANAYNGNNGRGPIHPGYANDVWVRTLNYLPKSKDEE